MLLIPPRSNRRYPLAQHANEALLSGLANVIPRSQPFYIDEEPSGQARIKLFQRVRYRLAARPRGFPWNVAVIEDARERAKPLRENVLASGNTDLRRLI